MDKYAIILIIVLAVLYGLVCLLGYLQIKAMKIKDETNQAIYKMLQTVLVLSFFVIFGYFLLSIIHESTLWYLKEILKKLEVLTRGR